jgi:hypothetical protein
MIVARLHPSSMRIATLSTSSPERVRWEGGIGGILGEDTGWGEGGKGESLVCVEEVGVQRAVGGVGVEVVVWMKRVEGG